MNINKIELRGIKNLLTGQLKNLGWIFFAAFLILLVLEGFEVKNSVNIILSSNKEATGVVNQPGVRINFDNYNKAVNKIQNGQTFVPSHSVTSDPFGTGH